jgi:HAD superfamily hydrolase (TIGR01484 family)
MKSLDQLTVCPRIILTDIDDTLTDEGQLKANAYSALWNLKENGFSIIPITGRPAGWCEMIARFWPVDGIVGENGAFYFRYTQGKMKRHFEVDENTRSKNRHQLLKIQDQILKEIPGSAIASDQFCRIADLAIDFCEDVPKLSETSILRIKEIFESHGAQAKVSSIHVNGWFGNYNKLTSTQNMLKAELGMNSQSILENCIFSGDSPNDEPLFEFFPNSVGVANVKNFISQMKSLPTYVTKKPGGDGFAELSEHLIYLAHSQRS